MVGFKTFYKKSIGETLGKIQSTNGQCVEKTKGIMIHCLKEGPLLKGGQRKRSQ